MTKRKFDVLFVLITLVILMVLNYYGILEEYAKFALIPLLIAYFLGQYVERKFKN